MFRIPASFFFSGNPSPRNRDRESSYTTPSSRSRHSRESDPSATTSREIRMVALLKITRTYTRENLPTYLSESTAGLWLRRAGQVKSCLLQLRHLNTMTTIPKRNAPTPCSSCIRRRLTRHRHSTPDNQNAHDRVSRSCTFSLWRNTCVFHSRYRIAR